MGRSSLFTGGALIGPLFPENVVDESTDPYEPASPGDIVGAFRIIQQLGRGGMGSVYLAERADGQFKQEVAIKFLNAPAIRDRFLRKRDGAQTLPLNLPRDDHASVEWIEHERRILGALRHPNIAMILDGGTTADGAPWFAMELVDGDRIDRYCDAESLSWRQRLDLLKQVAKAVDYAHRQLVVHRDIKPANVLIDAGGRPKLVDFGIAGSTAVPEECSTKSYAFTPEFASPEQLSGQSVTPASDVFQLGRLLDHLVCRREGDTSPVAMPRMVRSAVTAIVRRACRPDPQQRYPYADTLAAEIDRVLSSRPPKAQHAGVVVRLRLFLQRHAAAATVSAVALAMLAAATMHWVRQVAEERDIARAEAIQARIGSDVFSFAFGGRRAVADPNEARSIARLMDRAVGRYAKSPRQQLTALAAAGRLLLDLRQPAAARDLFRRTVIDGADWPAERAAAKIVEARAHRQDGELLQAHRTLVEAETLLSTIRPSRSLRAALDVEKVDILERMDEQAQAASIREVALAALEHADELDTDTLIRLLAWRASTVLQHGDIDEGTRLQRRIVALSEIYNGVDSWAAWREQRRLAWFLIQGRDYDGARSILQAQRRSISGEDSAERREHASLLTMEAQLADAEGDTVRAEMLSAQTHAIHREISQGSYDLAIASSNHANLLYKLGRMDEAITSYEEALSAQTGLLGHDHLNNLAVRLTIADIRCAQGDYARANADFSADLGAYRTHVNTTASDAAFAPVMWAECLLRQRRIDEARAVMQEADPSVTARQAEFEPQDRERVAQVRSALANAAPVIESTSANR